MKISAGKTVIYKGVTKKVLYAFQPSKEHMGYAVLDCGKTVFFNELEEPKSEKVLNKVKTAVSKAQKSLS